MNLVLIYAIAAPLIEFNDVSPNGPSQVFYISFIIFGIGDRRPPPSELIASFFLFIIPNLWNGLA